VPLGEEIPLERWRQRGLPPINRYFTTISSSSVRTVADSPNTRAITSVVEICELVAV